jgi:ribose/xylose/arabinose/galactoside ABC-type transport system permease subunit
MSLYRGLALLVVGGRDISDMPAGFRDAVQATPLGVPVSLWLALAAVGLAWFLFGWTVPGRRALALGSNPTAAERIGIRRGWIWLTMFALQGLLAGVAGLLALGMVPQLQGTEFEEKTLEAIGAAVVGGIAITGGRGSVWGIWAAALLLRVLEKGWVLLQVPVFWQRTIVGSLLLLAILGDRLWRYRGGQEERNE